MNYPRKHDWVKLQSIYDSEHLTYRQMKEMLGVGTNSITKAIKRREFQPRATIIGTKKNWQSIQEDYDKGYNYDELCKKYHIGTVTIQQAIKLNKFKPRTRSEAARLGKIRFPYKHSDETKKKISDIRRKYIEENPDKVPYLLNHSCKKSYVEEIFEKALIEQGILNFVYNYQNGIYQYDFAFIDKKIDVEVDGNTHLLESVKKIDKRRDEWSRQQGWRVLRFTAKEVKSNPVACVLHLKNIIMEA